LNLILIMKELWRRRALLIASFLAAAAIAILAVFQVSLAPPSISKRARVDAQGSMEILVDSARSPIADARRDLTGLTARAGVFARLMAGGNVVSRIAKATHIPVKQIDVAGPVPFPGEVPGTEQAALQLHPYGIAVTQTEALPIVKVTTRAPTVQEARALAAAAPAAIREVVRSVQAQQGTPPGKRIEFRVLGPAEAGITDDALGKKVALLLFIVLFAIFIVLILGVPRLITAWRTTEPDVGLPKAEAEPEQTPDVVHLPSGRGADSEEDDDLEATWIGRREP
jgi:hypothetical protein